MDAFSFFSCDFTSGSQLWSTATICAKVHGSLWRCRVDPFLSFLCLMNKAIANCGVQRRSLHEGQSALDWQRLTLRITQEGLKQAAINTNYTDIHIKLYFFIYEWDMVKYIIYFTRICTEMRLLPQALTLLICTRGSLWVMIFSVWFHNGVWH